MSGAARTGALLVNLGSPDSPSVGDVRRYLREFLSDPRVIDTSPLARWLLLELVILPLRPRRSAAAYAKIWGPPGSPSPLVEHGYALRDGVAKTLGDAWVVELGMRYGKPSIRSALDALAEAGVARLIVFPLFPQYAEASNGSALAEIAAQRDAMGWDVPVAEVAPCFVDPGFIESFAAAAREAFADFDPDFVLLSYHGLPERQIRALDPTGAHCFASDTCCDALSPAAQHCYRAQCFATSRALAGALSLEPDRHATSFQSRLGRTPWIQPFTDEVLPKLAERGVERLAVLCPSFVADCLETVEEIGIRAREQWRELGGDELRLVECPNTRPEWVEAVAALLRRA